MLELITMNLCPPVRNQFSTEMLKNDAVKLSIEDISNEKLSINLNNFLPQIMQNSPVFLMFNLSKNTNGMLNISDVKINDDKIYVKGIFIIPKNCDITE